MASYTAKVKVSLTILESKKYGKWLIPANEINKWLKSEVMQVAEGIIAVGSENLHYQATGLILRRAVQEGIFEFNEVGKGKI